MEATPFWFGPGDRPLMGWYHRPPTGRAHTGAVLCPPLGREHLQTYSAFRLLAEHLSRRGVATVRFDYDGTGESAGTDQDPGRVAAWLSSIRAAVEVVHRSGVDRVTVVGMRLGATLAGCAAEHDPYDGLVLWDPAVSGRSFLAEQKALSADFPRSAARRADGSVEGPGAVFSSETARDLLSVDLTKTDGTLARRILVLQRADRKPGKLAERFTGEEVEWMEAVGQAGLMDFGGEKQRLPLGTITTIADWVAAQSPGPPSRVEPPPPGGLVAVGVAPSGTKILEAPVSVPPVGLAGTLCRPLGRCTGPTIVFLSVSNEYRSGPCRLWTDMARQLAGVGMRSLRLDMSSVGDSPLRHAGQLRFWPHSLEAFDDVIDAVGYVSPGDPSDVVLVGLCSSAYQVLESALELAPLGVVAIQPVLTFRPPELDRGSTVGQRRRLAIPTTGLAEAFAGDGLLSPLRRRFPDLGWRIRMLMSPRRRPGRHLGQIDEAGVDTLLICGEWEGRPFRAGMSRRTRRRLNDGGLFRFVYRPELAHGLMVAEQRDFVAGTVLEHLVRRFGAGVRPPERAKGSGVLPVGAGPAPQYQPSGADLSSAEVLQ